MLAVARLPRAKALVLAGALMGGEIETTVREVRQPGLLVISLNITGSVPDAADLVVSHPVQAGVMSALIEEVQKGNEVILAKAGKPVARLVAYLGPTLRRTPGAMVGEIWIAPDFDALPEDFEEPLAPRVDSH